MWKGGKEFNWEERGWGFSFPTPVPPIRLVWRLQCMTLQRVVSAHAAAGVLVIRRLESMQSHANSRQASSSCIVCLSLARSEANTGQRKARPVHWCASHAVILLLREEKERENGQTAVTQTHTGLVSGLLKVHHCYEIFHDVPLQQWQHKQKMC